MDQTMHRNSMSVVKTAATINLLAGLWFFVSPWVYRVEHLQNSWNSWIFGGLIALLAIIRLSSPADTRALSVINLILGAWVFVSPWAFGYTMDTGRFVNSLCVGVIVFVSGVIAASVHETHDMHDTHLPAAM